MSHKIDVEFLLAQDEETLLIMLGNEAHRRDRKLYEMVSTKFGKIELENQLRKHKDILCSLWSEHKEQILDVKDMIMLITGALVALGETLMISVQVAVIAVKFYLDKICG